MVVVVAVVVAVAGFWLIAWYLVDSLTLVPIKQLIADHCSQKKYIVYANNLNHSVKMRKIGKERC